MDDMLTVLSMGRLAVNRVLTRLLACQALAVGLFARSSFAEDDGPASECPRPADVLAGLAQVVTSRFAILSAGDMVIHDYGETWAIEVRGRTSTYSDAPRDCVERARVATVFAALVIEPVDADQALAEPLAQLPPSAQPLAPASVAASATLPARPLRNRGAPGMSASGRPSTIFPGEGRSWAAISSWPRRGDVGLSPSSGQEVASAPTSRCAADS